MPILLLLLALPLVLIALMPLILLQRYRMGTARRLARPWMATLNLVLMVLSVPLPGPPLGSRRCGCRTPSRGAAAGCRLGTGTGPRRSCADAMGADTSRRLHYTPNRWLVLVVTFMVSARVGYGVWRSWKAAEAGVYGTEMVPGVRDPPSLARRAAR